MLTVIVLVKHDRRQGKSRQRSAGKTRLQVTGYRLQVAGRRLQILTTDNRSIHLLSFDIFHCQY